MKYPRVKLDSIKAEVPYAFVGGPFGSNLTTRDYVEEGVPVIRGSNQSSVSIFNDDDYVFVSDEKAVQLTPNLAFPGDVIFTQRGTLGQVGVIPENAKYDRYVISQSQMKLTVHPEKAEAKYIYYYFRRPDIVQTIINLSQSSGVPHINLGTLKNFEIPLPPVDIQKRIISFLSAYDDLIENNRRRIDLLEQSARMLYKEWFVSLRFPGHEHVKVKDDVPQGWEKTTLGEIAPLTYGKGLKADERIPGDYPVYGSSGIVGTHEKALATGPGIVVGRKGNAGSAFWSMSDFYPIDTTYYIDSSAANYFLYYLLLNSQFVSTDVAVPGLNRDYAHSLKINLPPKQLLSLFEETVSPIHEQIYKLEKYNQALTQARDLLLPRLMNGEILV